MLLQGELLMPQLVPWSVKPNLDAIFFYLEDRIAAKRLHQFLVTVLDPPDHFELGGPTSPGGAAGSSNST